MSRLISKMSTIKKETNIKVEFITFYKFCVLLILKSFEIGLSIKHINNYMKDNYLYRYTK